MAKRFTLDLQLVGYDFDKYDEKGEVTFEKFMEEFDNFPWMEQLRYLVSFQKGSLPKLFVKDGQTAISLWVSMWGDENENGYIIGYEYTILKKRFFGLVKPKEKQRMETYFTKDKNIVKQCFTLFFHQETDKLITTLHTCEKHKGKDIYSENELAILESHIEASFGNSITVLHEIYSSDIHVDICVIAPTAKRNYYTLVTMGMGAHKMKMPPDMQSKKLDRAELLITLPPDWELNNVDETCYWPIRFLKNMASFLVENDTWFGYGHTISDGEPFAENTKLSAMLVTLPYYFGEKSASCTLPNGDTVYFYQLVPLYANEMEFKFEHGVQALEDSFPDDFNMIVNINRKNLFA